MRVGQIVSYLSQDGAFGGPVAVAVAQSTELSRLGHKVELTGGWDGTFRLGQQNFESRLFPVIKLGRRLTGLFSVGVAHNVWTSRHRVEVLHIHLGRDVITTAAALIAMWRKIPYVVQTHGMIMPDQRLVTRVFDFLFTRRILACSHRVLTLSVTEEQGIQNVSRGRAVSELVTNGVRVDGIARKQDGGLPRVVFLARLHPRKRVMVFVQAAASLLRAGWDAEFEVYGPDEGDLQHLEAFLAAEGLDAIRYHGPVEPGTAQTVLARADVYVLPSFGEVVPMTVLESIAVGTPVVLTTDCAMAETLSAADAAVVTDGSVSEVSSAIAALLEDKAKASSIALRATAVMNDAYSLGAVARRLEGIYESAFEAQVEPRRGPC